LLNSFTIYCLNNPILFVDSNGNIPTHFAARSADTGDGVPQPYYNGKEWCIYAGGRYWTESEIRASKLIFTDGSINFFYSESNERLQINSNGNSSNGFLGEFLKFSIIEYLRQSWYGRK